MSRPRVLLVDDDPGLRRTLQILLEDEGGCDVLAASSGDDALMSLTRDASVGVVVSDVRMPGIDGFELLRRTRGTRPGLPVILMTAYPSLAGREQALVAGAFAYLAKPIDPGELLAGVIRALRGA